MRKINEIFHSLQGEGYHAGVSAVFVRFSGCNLHCPFCDTRHHDGRLMEDEEIFNEINRYSAALVILTGGEPAMWIDEKFVDDLHKATHKKIAIETNGTLPLPAGLDWICVSPKGGIAAEPDNAELKCSRADEIKVVDVGQDLEQYFNLPIRTEATKMYLQPCFDNDSDIWHKNLNRTVNRVLEDSRWILSVQLHRFLGIP